MEIIVGTYEEYILGYKVEKKENKTYSLKQTFANYSHTGSVRAVVVAGRILASGGTDEFIRLSNLEKKVEHGVLMQHQGNVTCLDFFTSSHLFSGSDDGQIFIWHTGKWQCEKTLHAHKGGVTGVSVHPTGKLALSVGKDKTLKTWNLITGRTGYITNIKAVADFVKWSDDGSLYIVGIRTQVLVYSISIAGVIYTINLGRLARCVAFINSDVVAVGGEGEMVEFHHVHKQTKVAEFQAHETRVRALSCHHFENKMVWLISASSDGYIKLWKLKVKHLETPPVLVAEVSTSCRITCMTVWKGSARGPVVVEAVEEEAVEQGEEMEDDSDVGGEELAGDSSDKIVEESLSERLQEQETVSLVAKDSNPLDVTVVDEDGVKNEDKVTECERNRKAEKRKKLVKVGTKVKKDVMGKSHQQTADSDASVVLSDGGTTKKRLKKDKQKMTELQSTGNTKTFLNEKPGVKKTKKRKHEDIVEKNIPKKQDSKMLKTKKVIHMS